MVFQDSSIWIILLSWEGSGPRAEGNPETHLQKYQEPPQMARTTSPLCEIEPVGPALYKTESKAILLPG
jgi:hypothetical protein